jgi:hypothetical protein
VPGAPQAPAPGRGVTPIFDAQTGLAEGWDDLGWCPRQISPGAPASLDLSGRGGWIVRRQDLTGSFGWLTFRLRAAESKPFLEVGLDSAGPARFPRVRIQPESGAREPDGFSRFRISMRELNPAKAAFDRVLFEAFRDVSSERVLFDQIALLRPDPELDAQELQAAPVRMSIQCSAPARRISPLIYGVAHGDANWWETGATARRWGGNPNTRYNWEEGSAWNAGNDWFFMNVNYAGKPGRAYEGFLEDNLKHGAVSALTVPIIGWVAKDSHSYAFPVKLLGPQQKVAPDNSDMGNGIGLDGSPLTPLSPTQTSVAAPPEFIRNWVLAIQRKDGARGRRSVQEYILDNEPTLWDTNHRDVHPKPVSYDELLERTLSYGTAVRNADPEASIAGFVAWGWPALFQSALDTKTNSLDKAAHGGVPLLPWWLRKVREQEKRTGTRLIDVVDVHFYPQANGVGLGTGGETDPATSALRIRSTRAFWDPTYKDESWIGDTVMLIPRVQAWIAENAPGMGLSIGEYNFGAEGHMSGGLALAEALGRFGQNGLTSAFYWTVPNKGSPAWWAFRAYRNFDGNGGHFLDLSVPARSAAPLSSIFASRDPSGRRMVVILLNLDPGKAIQAEIDLSHCGEAKSRRAFSYAGTADGLVQLRSPGQVKRRTLVQRILPYSITVVDLDLESH